MREIELGVNALSNEFRTEGDPIDSGREVQDFSKVVCCRVMVQANERFGALA
jgi:hypothetical protein